MRAMITMNTSPHSIGNGTDMDDLQVDGNQSTEGRMHNYTEISTVWDWASNVSQSHEKHTFTSHVPTPAPQKLSAWDDILLVSDEYENLVTTITDVLYYVQVVILPTAFFFTVCNVIVFLHPRMRSMSSKYIVMVSFAQLVNLIILGLSDILYTTIANPLDDYTFWIFSMFFGAYLNAVSRRGTYIVLCLVSGQRLYAVLRPLHVKSLVLTRYPVLLTAAAYAFSAVWHFHIAAKFEIKGIDVGTKIIYKPVASALHRNHREVSVGFSFATQILINLTLFTQLTLSVLTVWALRRHNLVASQVSSSTRDDTKRRQERQLTVTILSATVAFVILSIPEDVHFQFINLYGEYSFEGEYKNINKIVNAVVGKIAIFSYIIDFLCFVTISSNYRAALCQMLGFNKMLSADKIENDVTSETDPSTGEITTVAKDVCLKTEQ